MLARIRTSRSRLHYGAIHQSRSTSNFATQRFVTRCLTCDLVRTGFHNVARSLPMTLSEGLSREISALAEAYRVGLELLSLHSWSLDTSRVFLQCTPQTLA